MAENGDMTLTHDCRILILTFNSQIMLWKDWNPSERTDLQRWFANLPTKQNACFLFKYSHICFYKTTPLMSRASVLHLNVTVHLAACCR